MYDFNVVNELASHCSHVPPSDWRDTDKYQACTPIYDAWQTFLQSLGIEHMPCKNNATLFLVPPNLPWNAPNLKDCQLCALVMNYLTTQESNSYKSTSQHTSNALLSSGHIQSSCWQLVRQSVGDELYFNNCIKLEACPYAYPYKSKWTDVLHQRMLHVSNVIMQSSSRLL